MSMIERVARALQKHARGLDMDITWRDYVDDARVAIAAMREPTEEMKRAWTSSTNLPKAIWQAMIDAALEGDKQ